MEINNRMLSPININLKSNVLQINIIHCGDSYIFVSIQFDYIFKLKSIHSKKIKDD